MSDEALFELNSPEIPESSTVKDSLSVEATCNDLLQVAEVAPERSLLIASGRFHYINTWGDVLPDARNGGSMEACTIRPLPDEWQKQRGGPRLFEVLAFGASRSDQFMVTTPELLTAVELVWSAP